MAMPSSYHGPNSVPYVDGVPDRRALEQRHRLAVDQAELDELVLETDRATRATKGGGSG